MKKTTKIIPLIILTTAFSMGQATAASWQDQLSSVANELSKNQTSTTSAPNGSLSLSSLTTLLNGGNQALCTNSMTNATGIITYCVKNKLTTATNAENIQSQLMNKLGLGSTTGTVQPQDYKQGLAGLLNTSNGQQLNLNSIGSSPLAEKVKTKACDLVLKQGMKYLF